MIVSRETNLIYGYVLRETSYNAFAMFHVKHDVVIKKWHIFLFYFKVNY